MGVILVGSPSTIAAGTNADWDIWFLQGGSYFAPVASGTPMLFQPGQTFDAPLEVTLLTLALQDVPTLPPSIRAFFAQQGIFFQVYRGHVRISNTGNGPVWYQMVFGSA
jgi:hypothetical protein